MCTTTLALAAQIKSTSIRRTTRIMTCFCVGGALGWPFSLALAGSMFLEELLFYGTSVALALRRVMHGMVTCLAVVVRACVCVSFWLTDAQAVIVAIDSAAYRKLACVALNIVKYNVLAGEGRGPNLYGTEPWHYYAQNLFLSFNVASLLACISAPCLIVSALLPSNSDSHNPRLSQPYEAARPPCGHNGFSSCVYQCIRGLPSSHCSHTRKSALCFPYTRHLPCVLPYLWAQ